MKSKDAKAQVVLDGITTALMAGTTTIVPGTYIMFRREPAMKKGITEIYSVNSSVAIPVEGAGWVVGSEVIGYIKWFGRWRKYGFFPKPDTIYEETCLREIAHFGQMLTHVHRLLKAQERVKAKYGDGPIDLWPKDLLEAPHGS
jgi:hypothetical protein